MIKVDIYGETARGEDNYSTVKSLIKNATLFVKALNMPSEEIDYSELENKDLKEAWQKCIDKELDSRGARRAEKEGGKLGLGEYLIDRCGSRPTLEKPGGKVSLLKEDCDTLYDIAQEGSCGSLAAFQVSFIKELNSEVFDESRFAKTCAQMEKQPSLSRSAFGAQVCGE